MPERCVVAGCSNVTYIKMASLCIAEAKQRRRKWIKFVNRKRAKWLPSMSSVACSVHFMPEDFANCFVALPELNILSGAIKAPHLPIFRFCPTLWTLLGPPKYSFFFTNSLF